MPSVLSRVVQSTAGNRRRPRHLTHKAVITHEESGADPTLPLTHSPNTANQGVKPAATIAARERSGGRHKFLESGALLRGPINNHRPKHPGPED